MNRILTPYDTPNYAQPGDLLFDSYTKDRQILYFKFSEAFPDLEDHKTLWIDGKLLNELSDFKLCNGMLDGAYQPWHIKGLTIRPVPGTQVNINSNLNYGFCVHGLEEYLKIWGTKKPKRVFETGLYGIKVHINSNSGQGFSLSVQPGGEVSISKVESSGGFSALRVHGDRGGRIGFFGEDLYLRDTVDGEGAYIGNTKASNYTKFYGEIRNVKTLRTACEGLQLQHCDGMNVFDSIVYASGTSWINPFQIWQDTAVQWVCAGDFNLLSNLLVDGFVSVGLSLMGGDGFNAYNVANKATIYNGKGTGINIHNSCKTDAIWELGDVSFGEMTKEYFTTTKLTGSSHIISPNNGTDDIRWSNISTNAKAPKYVNSGFDNSSITQWKHYWAGHFQGGNKEVPTTWKQNQIVIDTNGGYGIYKCMVDHTTDGISPKSSDKFMKLTWDENGTRNDKDGWEPTKQSDCSPDDLRLLL